MDISSFKKIFKTILPSVQDFLEKKALSAD